jgi:two-component system CheB/CheR fusion protein
MQKPRESGYLHENNREELQALTGSLLHRQEEEWRRLARELHDDVIQRVAVLSMDIDEVLRMLETDPTAAVQKLQQSSENVALLSERVRDLSRRLHPAILEDIGLAAALESLTEEFRDREEMVTDFLALGIPPALRPDVATGFYRIAQEAFRNIAKHAGKTHVKVTLSGSRDELQMRIADAGRGFDIGMGHTGLGLIGMQERARLIGATIEIQSRPGEGAKITVRVPIREATVSSNEED